MNSHRAAAQAALGCDHSIACDHRIQHPRNLQLNRHTRPPTHISGGRCETRNKGIRRGAKHGIREYGGGRNTEYGNTQAYMYDTYSARARLRAQRKRRSRC
eukprot:6566161-Prymnesium_polylepis.1